MSTIVTWKAVSSLVLLLSLVLVVVVLVKIIRLVLTGRTGRSEQAPPPVQEPPTTYGPGTPLRSLRLTVSAAAFLVPMAMAVFLAVVAALAVGQDTMPSENPFGIHMMWYGLPGGLWAGDHHLQNILILGLVAVCLAGHVGLLRAAYANRTPSSADFLQGIKDHTATFILGKLLLCLGVVAISAVVGHSTTWTGILFVVPSLLLAPLMGTAALYPRKPGQAIKAAFAHSSSDVHGTGKLVTIQVLLLLAAWIIYGAVQSQPAQMANWYIKVGGMFQVPLLANGWSTLSFNTFPMIPMCEGGIGEIAVIAFTVMTSTVFLGCHFLKVMDTAREQAAEAAATTAGEAA